MLFEQRDVVHREERGQTRSAGAVRDSGAGTRKEPLPLQRTAQVLRGKDHSNTSFVCMELIIIIITK